MHSGNHHRGEIRWRTRALRLLAAWAACAALAVGCGGGVGVDGTGSLPPTLAVGPISNFGSIVVNGVHYDNSAAQVEDQGGKGRTNADLRLGMVVEVEAGSITAASGTTPARATASTVRVVSELLGPVDSAPAADGSLVVMGQTVRTTSATVLEGFTNGLSGVAANSVVEVFGYFDPATQSYTATRLEPRSGSVTSFRIRGIVAGLNTAASTLRIGNQTFVFADVKSTAPADLADGSYVRLTVKVVRDAQGRWEVQAFNKGRPDRSDAQEFELKGLITRYDTATPAQFTVNGIPVDASAVSPLPSGLALGVRVEVEGALRAGTLVARKIEVEDGEQAGGFRFEFEGTVAAVDSTARTFTLRNRPDAIYYGRSDLVVEGGPLETKLVVGARLEGRGVLSTDRARIEATQIHIEN
jgi:hypothetical protein